MILDMRNDALCSMHLRLAALDVSDIGAAEIILKESLHKRQRAGFHVLQTLHRCRQGTDAMRHDGDNRLFRTRAVRRGKHANWAARND